mmetsp:Transcript_12690/g.41837  ORF Transcript_12690/g.41837 Transcript_12690/m.41837 type:complete len:325 (+) Transcript_12690:60-1034(+)
MAQPTDAPAPPPEKPQEKDETWVDVITMRRLVQLLFGRWLMKAPARPKLKVVPRLHNLECEWTCKTTSPWNRDYFELQLKPTAEDLKRLMGSFLDFERDYRGVKHSHTTKNLPASRPYLVRVRAINAAGVSAWTEVETATCQKPVNWGGTGPGHAGAPDYRWDQDPDQVEVFVPLEPDVRTKDVFLEVHSKRMKLTVRGKVLMAGLFHKEIKAQDVGEWEWEVRGDGKDRHLYIVLEKKDNSTFQIHEQWDCLFEGHPRIDCRYNKWSRDYDFRPTVHVNDPDKIKTILPDNKFFEKDPTLMPAEEDVEAESWGTEWRQNQKSR